MDFADLKRELRRRQLDARHALTTQDREAAGAALVTAAAPALAGAGTVAVYLALPDEPPLAPLIGSLLERGVSLLFPALNEDRSLDWIEHSAEWLPGLQGTQHPAGPRLGSDALATVDAVLVPGLAVDGRGVRLGRGGGSYDRALTAARPGTLVAVVLFDGEVLAQVPSERHDVPVNAVLTPAGLRQLDGADDRP